MASDDFTVAVIEDVDGSRASYLSTYRVGIDDSTGRPTISKRSTYSSSDELRDPATSYSPSSGRVVAAFERWTSEYTNQNDLWGDAYEP